MIYHQFSLVLCLMLFSAAFGALDYDLENNVKELVARRRYLKFMKQLVDDMDNQISRLQKRTCYFNAGMSHSCDYKDIATAVDDHNYWASDNSPGKKKRSLAEPDANESRITQDGVRKLLNSIRRPGEYKRRR